MTGMPHALTVCAEPGCPRAAVRKGRCREHQIRYPDPGRLSGWERNRLRRRVIARDGERCQVCGATERLEVHHRNASRPTTGSSTSNCAAASTIREAPACTRCGRRPSRPPWSPCAPATHATDGSRVLVVYIAAGFAVWVGLCVLAEHLWSFDFADFTGKALAVLVVTAIVGTAALAIVAAATVRLGEEWKGPEGWSPDSRFVRGCRQTGADVPGRVAWLRAERAARDGRPAA
jgi:5-methylcytosine-specific restriction protein A